MNGLAVNNPENGCERVTHAADMIGWRRPRRSEDVEQLVNWAYAVQRVDVMLGRGLAEQEAALERIGPSGISGDGVAMIERIGLLGCRVQSGGVQQPASVHMDAETIHDAVLTLEQPIAQLVMRHARDRSRPDWGRDLVPTFRVPRGRKGNPLIVYDATDVARNYGHCPIEWIVDAREIETRRGVYAVWRRALYEIGVELVRRGRLLDVRPTGPLAPAEPWAVRMQS